jgi:uncharacterized protein (TIGR02599 family)
MRRPIAFPTSSLGASAFTLLEMLVSTTILAVIVVLLARVMSDTAAIWRRTTAKVDQFREARTAFETLTTRLAQATLNTYWDYQYDNPTSATRIPVKYTRRSELRFIAGPSTTVLGKDDRERPTHCVFFQAPFGETEAIGPNGAEEFAGFENLLCAWGYYLEYAGDENLRPGFLPKGVFPQRYRYRLMEWRQPAEGNRIFSFTSGLDPKQQNYAQRDWFTASVNLPTSPHSRVAAENVIAMIITPRLAKADEAAIKSGKNEQYSPLAPNYLYDSAPTTAAYKDGRVNPVHQLPPLLQVTLVAMDETSAQRMNLGAKPGDPFQLQRAARFTNTADYSKDLLLSGDKDSLENQLIKRGANYRIFSTNVVIRGAKWSRETTN